MNVKGTFKLRKLTNVNEIYSANLCLKYSLKHPSLLLIKCVLLPKNVKMQIIVVKICTIFAIKNCIIDFSLKNEIGITSGKNIQKVANCGNYKNNLLSIIKFYCNFRPFVI